METIRDGKMDDKGYAFTPLALLLMIPVVIIAISYNGIVNEVNTLSTIAIGGDVTATVADDVVNAIQQDTADAGRRSAFLAVETVINGTQLVANNHPFFSQTAGNNSTTFILSNTANMLNTNLTSTCIALENQTGRSIYINNSYVNPSSTVINYFKPGSMTISQNDPFGFTITEPSVPVTVAQNGQNVTFTIPPQSAYVSIEGLDDPYIWVNTKERNSSVIYGYPYDDNFMGNWEYHFADNVSQGNLHYLWECLVGSPNASVMSSYYFPDPYGLTFFDRLENRTNATSLGPNSAKMSTFILWNPLPETHIGYNLSMLDHEYFAGVSGSTVTTNHGSTTDNVIGPDSNPFYLSSTYKGYLGLSGSPYSY